MKKRARGTWGKSMLRILEKDLTRGMVHKRFMAVDLEDTNDQSKARTNPKAKYKQRKKK